MRQAWNKGLTKSSNASVRKTSDTMKLRQIDNFAKWRIKARKEGLIPRKYSRLKKSGDLAELIGTTLGDGHIGVFPRTEVLRLVASGAHPASADRWGMLIYKVFGKAPTIIKRKNSNCYNVTLYQKHISERLEIPTGARAEYAFTLPDWIRNTRAYYIRFLRGLYEAEGSYSVHKSTYTYKFLFNNKNESLLRVVHEGMTALGFHPHTSSFKVQLSRREEVAKAMKLVHFRDYK